MLIMGAVLLLLIGVADGVETFCDATQPHITTQCFGSLGGTVEVLLPTKTSQDDIYKLKKNDVPILSDRSQTTNIRYSFNVSTGMFAIKEFNRTDKGTYWMEVHDQNGIEISFNLFRLSIEGVKTFCDATQPHIPTQCFGSLGGTVEVQLPTHSPQEHSYTLKKNKVPIVEGEIKITDPRYSFDVGTGVFTIEDLKKTDYDNYTIAAHNGIKMTTKLLSIQGVKTFCDATQPHIPTQCFGSLGGTVKVLLPAKTSQDDIYKLKKDNVTITDNTRYSFNSDTKTFMIMDINTSDGGTYSMEVLDKNEAQVKNTNFYLSNQGVKTFCDATQPHITTQCFGSLGGTVEVQLPTRTSQNDIYKLKKNNVPIVEYKSQTKNVDYSFNVNTGIFTINDINRTEDDTYSIEAQNRNGIDLSNIQFNLSIQAPVSSPLLSRECLSRGQQRVSCSAGGDGLHYSWSLDGLPLNDTRLLSGPSSASDVTLEPGRLGLLTCSVRNNVSHAAANITLSECDVGAQRQQYLMP
ncbi:uncharacterized protein LOC130390395 isoform X2 [Gadus chalcogrammus]|uniref:uncharacterized protein LOC130390395 isoform X2 n=1 Tax=Gadus chalcogrammus TaxID=1042646 RepID=UPI0024C4BF40|nr:uncharacterized protein LOC130390395 isoform X2 [Gadus chalcogrammus]